MNNDRMDIQTTWLRELVRVRTTSLEIGPAIRAALAVSVPMSAGLLFGATGASLMVALGALQCAMMDSTASYRARFRQMAIVSALGSTGFLLGYLGTLPFWLLVSVMGLVAFVSGIVASFGAAWASGAMYLLLYAGVAIGTPDIGPFWQPAALSLLGAGFYMLMLGIVAILDRRRPERARLIGLLNRLSDLARIRAEAPSLAASGDTVVAARRAVTDALITLEAEIATLRSGGRTHETETLAEFLDAADAISAAILAERDAAVLDVAAEWLTHLSAAMAQGGATLPSLPEADGQNQSRALFAALGKLGTSAVSGEMVPRGHAVVRRLHKPWGELSLPHLTVGASALSNAARLGLCVVVAYAAHYVLQITHWYWVPVTVAIVMRPDLGSIFARAVLRTVGTTIGALVGVGLLSLFHPGAGLVLVLALLASLIPAAKGINYAAQMLVITPVILILLDLLAPSTQTQTLILVEDRVLATLIGSAIVLVFGYLLWPRDQPHALVQQFNAAMDATAAYLETAFTTPEVPRAQIGAAERKAYATLSNLRIALSRAMAEPGSAGRNAAMWYPLVASIERLCDLITVGAPNQTEPHPPTRDTAFLAAELRGLIARARQPDAVDEATTSWDDAAFTLDPALRDIESEVAQIGRRLKEILSHPAAKPSRTNTAPSR